MKKVRYIKNIHRVNFNPNFSKCVILLEKCPQQLKIKYVAICKPNKAVDKNTLVPLNYYCLILVMNYITDDIATGCSYKIVLYN